MPQLDQPDPSLVLAMSRLGTIDVGENGKGILSRATLDLWLSGDSQSIAGRSIVLTQKKDARNHDTSESRVACGVIVISGK